MPDSQTVRRDYTKPEDGASEDTWGVKLNQNFDDIDGDIYALLTDAGYAADSGLVNALVADPDPALDQYMAGLCVRVKVAVTNTGSATLNVNSLGAKNVLANDGSNLTAGSLVAGGIYDFHYDGTQFRVSPAVLFASAAEVLTGTDATKVITPAAFAGNKLLAEDGYYKLPGGLIIQWGYEAVATTEGAVSLTYPIPFPTACYSLVGTIHNAASGVDLHHDVQVISAGTSTASIYIQRGASGSGTPTGYFWQAFGR